MYAVLTKRDIAALVDVYKYRYLSVSQVRQLHFPSKRVAWRRLQGLTDMQYLKAFTAPGISERVYYLDQKGAEIVADEMQVGFNDLAWHRSARTPKDYYFLRHFLSINDFRINLTLACQNSGVRLIGFIPEYIGEKTPKGHVRKYLRDKVCDIADAKHYISHTPDAAFALEKEGRAALFFVEADRGIETISKPDEGFLKAIVFYLNYWTSGEFKKYAKDFEGVEFARFRTLIVTTSPRRLKNMQEVVTKYPFPKNNVKRFLWGATNVTKDTIFTPIWQSMDVNDKTTYKIG